MKILLYASDNSDRSGAFLSMCYLAKCLRNEHNVDCRVVLPKKGTGTRVLEQLDVPYTVILNYDWIIPIDCGNLCKNFIMRLKKYIKYLINFMNMTKHKKYVKSFKPDIIHINTICSYVPALVAEQYRIPFVWHIREFLEEDWHNKIHFQKYGYKLINKADKVICISKSVRDKFQSVIDIDKISVIYNGINPYKFHSQLQKDTNSREIDIVCVGSLVKQKGQNLLIEAVSHLNEKKYNNIKVHIVGTGPENNHLLNLSKKLGVAEFIIFEGYSEETEKYFSRADITVVPSYFEPFGRVTVEAMMSGSFVIGSNTAGTVELIGNNEFGRIFKCGDSKDLADQIEWAINNSIERNRISSLAKERALNEFTDSSNAEKIYNTYTELLGL